MSGCRTPKCWGRPGHDGLCPIPRYSAEQSLFDPPSLDEIRPTRTRVRDNDPMTSALGAADVVPRISGQKRLLLAAFVDAGGPLTSYEAGMATGLALKPGCCYWHRVTDLADGKLIARTGLDRRMPTGSMQAEYVPTALGLAAKVLPKN